MHEDTRMTAFAYAGATREGIDEIGFLPCRLTPDGLVHPLRLGSAEATEVVAFLEKCNSSQRLKSSIVSSGSNTIAGFETLRVVPS
jgi:poly-gamma-glutamate synthesis protein (capsule biosynthesis protein)